MLLLITCPSILALEVRTLNKGHGKCPLAPIILLSGRVNNTFNARHRSRPCVHVSDLCITRMEATKFALSQVVFGVRMRRFMRQAENWFEYRRLCPWNSAYSRSMRASIRSLRCPNESDNDYETRTSAGALGDAPSERLSIGSSRCSSHSHNVQGTFDVTDTTRRRTVCVESQCVL